MAQEESLGLRLWCRELALGWGWGGPQSWGPSGYNPWTAVTTRMQPLGTLPRIGVSIP